MTLPQVVEELYLAHKARATGWITVTAEGRESQLLIREGDVVGASFGSGYQSMAQALLQAGRISSQQLDLLWAQGEFGVLPEDSLNELAIPAHDAHTLHVLSNVRRLVARADSARFDEGEVEPGGPEVDGAQVIRSSLVVEPGEWEGRWLRCVDIEAAGKWGWSTEDSEFVYSLQEFRSAEGATGTQRAILKLLLREGLLEQLSQEAWDARAAAAPPEPALAEEPVSARTPLQYIPTLDEPAQHTEPTTEPVEIPNLARAAPVPIQPMAPAQPDGWASAMAEAAGHSEPEVIAEAAPASEEESAEAFWAVGEDATVPRAVNPLLATEEDTVVRRVNLTADMTDPQPGWGELVGGAGEGPAQASEVQFDTASAPAGEGWDAPEPTMPVAPPPDDSDPWRVVKFDAPKESTEPVSQEFPAIDIEAPVSASGLAEEHTASAWTLGTDELAEDTQTHDEALMADSSDSEAARRRQRLLRRAMENMGTFASRPAARMDHAEPVAPPQAPEPTAPGLNAAEQQLAQQIEVRYQAIQAKQDHFTILDLNRDANREQVKAAYLALVKTFHPDRLPASLASMASQMTTVFEAVRQAYEVLYDDAKRTAYLNALAGPGLRAPTATSSPGGPVEASDQFQMGEVFARKREFRKAEQHYMNAHHKSPKAEYLAAAAWAIYMDPSRRAEGVKARQLMNDALKLDPRCDRAHYQLGVIARVEGDMARAERHFREAVEANPKHLEANQELRLLEMRKKKEKKGLF